MSHAVAVASLNLLGDAYNAFEFMEPASSSPHFADNYEPVRAALMGLSTKDVVQECRSLGFDVDIAVPHEVFVENCSSDFLRRDNKLSLASRTNLIIGGMVPTEFEGKKAPMFKFWKEWRQLIKSRKDSYLQSGVDGPILLWDIACSLAAESAAVAFTKISEASYLNPERLEGNAARLLEPLEGHKLFVVAAQEFPEAGSAKRKALQEIMLQQDLRSVDCGDVGFLFSNGITVQQHKESPLGTNAPSVIAAVTAKFPALPPLDLSAEEMQRLETAFAKTIVLDVEPHLRLINVHVKELKTPPGTRFLARYMRALADEARDNVVLSDTNIPDPAKARVFAEECAECELTVLTRAGTTTTRKKRSELHGQLPDRNKCLRVVEAHKDFLLFYAARAAWTAERGACYPDLDADPALLIPNSAWATDHCMVTAVLTAV